MTSKSRHLNFKQITFQELVMDKLSTPVLVMLINRDEKSLVQSLTKRCECDTLLM